MRPLDLSAIMAFYDEERGQPPYHPRMMVALLLYADSRGVYSSRQIARGCEERLDFQAVTALNRPDFRTISDLRKRHLEALAGRLQQVLRLCRRAGLVGFGHPTVGFRRMLFSNGLVFRRPRVGPAGCGAARLKSGSARMGAC